VNTRLAKLDQGEYAAVILAAAGLRRLGLTERLRSLLPETEFLPAAAQGVLGIQCREADTPLREQLSVLNHAESEARATAERAVSRRLGANCQVPVAAFATLKQDQLNVRGLVASLDGTVMLRAERTGPLSAAFALGVAVGDDLLTQGAAAILQACKR
jgi:hydroxymethylbilane synthase